MLYFLTEVVKLLSMNSWLSTTQTEGVRVVRIIFIMILGRFCGFVTFTLSRAVLDGSSLIFKNAKRSYGHQV